ncbi:hypothetical protein [Ascidiimonas aurantiaca]|uniref:hypothetical protein n=1 Tax=Ascidiimonas aurantiaca TaxID=1685432 RepID=UPI0030EE27EC
MKTLTLEELSKLFDLTIKKLKDSNIEEIKIEEDFYRFIPADKWDSYEEDIILNGSLFDDVDSLKAHFSNNKRPFTYVDFDRLSSVLNYISNKENPVEI